MLLVLPLPPPPPLQGELLHYDERLSRPCFGWCMRGRTPKWLRLPACNCALPAPSLASCPSLAGGSGCGRWCQRTLAGWRAAFAKLCSGRGGAHEALLGPGVARSDGKGGGGGGGGLSSWLPSWLGFGGPAKRGRSSAKGGSGSSARSRSPSPTKPTPRDEKDSKPSPLNKQASTVGTYEALLQLHRKKALGCFGEMWRDFLLALQHTAGGNFQLSHKFRWWRDRARKMANTVRKMRHSLSTLLLRQERAATNKWLEFVEQRKESIALLQKAFTGLRLADVRRCYLTWVHIWQEVRDAKKRVAAALRRASPEGKAQLKALFKMRDDLYECAAAAVAHPPPTRQTQHAPASLHIPP